MNVGIDGKYNIEIDGLGYTLARQPRTNRPVYKREEAPAFVNKFGAGDPSYRDSTFWSHWVQINWQNGARQEQFNDQARFLVDSNINIHEEGRISLNSKIESAGVLASTATVCAMADSWWTGSDYRLWGANALGGIYEWNEDTTWTLKYETAFTPITDMFAIDSSVWVGTSGGRVYRLGVSGNFQSSSNPGNSKVNFITSSDVTGDDLLYIGTTSQGSTGGQLRSSSYNVSSFTTVWSSGRSQVLAAANYFGRMVLAAGGPLGNTTGSQAYKGVIAVYDGATTTTLVDMSHTVPTTLSVFDNLLFVGTSHGHLYVYNGASFDLLFKFWGNDIDMKIERLWVHQDKLFILVSQDSNLKNSETKYAGVWTFNRRGMNLDFKSGDTISAYTRIYTFKNQLIFANGGAGQVQRTNENTYNVSGELQSSYFDANLPSLDKLFKEATVIYDYLSANTSATIQYKTDETESFTSLGTIQTEGSTSATFQFPASTAKKKISYNVILSTGAVSSTPRVKKVISRYIPMPDFYHRWQFAVDTSEKIQLLDKTFHPSSGLELESALFASKRLKQVIEYKDVDYTSTTLDGAIAASASVINGVDFTNLPPKGRLRLPSTGEEITYTSRTSATLSGVTRGYKGTVAVSAANGVTIDNSYQAILQSMNEEQFFLNQMSGEFNHITPLTLLET